MRTFRRYLVGSWSRFKRRLLHEILCQKTCPRPGHGVCAVHPDGARSGRAPKESRPQATRQPIPDFTGFVERHWTEIDGHGRGLSRRQIRLQAESLPEVVCRTALARGWRKLLLHRPGKGREAALRRSKTIRLQDQGGRGGVCKAVLCGWRGIDQEQRRQRIERSVG